jgi:acyl-CoA thioester hydrolase
MQKPGIDKSKFKHKHPVRVRTFEVDSQGIVHNAVYLQYFEIGRVEYRRSFGYTINSEGIFTDGLKVVVVNNTINYHEPAYLDELLNVYTRIEWIKNSSFGFDQFIENSGTGNIICTAKGVLVNLNPSSNIPEGLSAGFITELKNFETDLEFKS